jgi:hypothetical protein
VLVDCGSSDEMARIVPCSLTQASRRENHSQFASFDALVMAFQLIYLRQNKTVFNIQQSQLPISSLM